MDQITSAVAWRLRKAIDGRRRTEPTRDGTAVVMSRDADGTIWVNIHGSDIRTPVNGTVNAEVHPNDVVGYHIENGRLSITGNPSNPSVGATRVKSIVEPIDRKASDAITYAETARNAADLAESEAQRASTAADTAQERATAAQESADAAQTSANTALRASNDALTQLSIVEDVAGTITWISEHGSYVATTDTSVQDGTVYFELVSGDYVPIAQPDPEANPRTEGWYVLDITDSQTDYIMAHLAVTSAGLWVLPSGIDSQDGARYSSGYKLLLASDGARLYDGDGHLVTTYGESIEFSSSRPQHIGGENAYIRYYDGNGDGVPDSIYIGGSNVSIGGKTLSQFEQAITDAATAKKYAEDVPIVTLSSTNGTTFKRNLGVSTTIIATIFTPGGRIDNATELHRRFGAGAYLAWGWRDVVTDADHVLVSTDPRIIMDGFGLVVSPEDIDVQAVITCSLNY